MRALFWQTMIEKCFSEPTIYDGIVSSGQYLKLCTLAEYVASQVDESWRQVILEADAIGAGIICVGEALADFNCDQAMVDRA